MCRACSTHPAPPTGSLLSAHPGGRNLRRRVDNTSACYGVCASGAQLMSDTSDTAEKRQRCAALRKDGQPCHALAMHTGLCIAHAPEANRWRVLGGQATRTSERAMKLLPLRLVPIFPRLQQVFLKLDA